MNLRISAAMFGICATLLIVAVSLNAKAEAAVPTLTAEVTVPASYVDGTPLVPLLYLLYIDGVKVVESSTAVFKLDPVLTAKYVGKKIGISVAVMGSKITVSEMSNTVVVDLRSIPTIKLRIKVTGLVTSTEVILE